nr:RNA-directed DNA polymerase, eukaryota, reverse transcriptase zinc-binding domain protein [Tanacetum cinerariifolium]
MLKFPIAGGVVTLRSSKIIPIECEMVSRLEDNLQLYEGQNKLCDLLQHNLDVFAWKPADMIGVPRHIAEHRLNIRKGCPPVRQKRRSQAADRNHAIQEEVEIKSHLNVVGITAAHIDVNTALRKNGATLPRTQVVDGVTTVLPITTAEEKAQRRLEVKAQSTLMMGLIHKALLHGTFATHMRKAICVRNHDCKGGQKSKEDEVHQLSTSVFVTNFPDMFGAKDLWNSCKSYGHVVDAYIPDRRSKAGKRFGFVRFIKVPNVDRLVSNLCTVWVGRYKLHANVARFQRAPVNKYNDKINVNGSSSFKVGSMTSGDGVKGTNNSFAYVVKGDKVLKDVGDDTPMMVLDEACLNTNDYSLSLFGKVKEFASLTNLKVVLAKEGYTNIDLKYMGGFWVMIGFQDVETKNRWKLREFRVSGGLGTLLTVLQLDGGRLLNGEELEEGFYHINRICISTKINKAVFESFKMVYRGNVFWVRAIEVPGWVPERKNVRKMLMMSQLMEMFKGASRGSYMKRETILKKKREVCKNDINKDDSIKYPQRFTPVVGVESGEGIEGEIKENSNSCDLNGNECGEKQPVERNVYSDDAQASNCLGHFKKSGAPRTGGSILEWIDDLVKVGQTMGYEMKGCMKNMEEIINLKRENDIFGVLRVVGGNLAFDYAYSEAVGNYGGILCIWDPNMFRKMNVTVSDYFTMVRGVWVTSGLVEVTLGGCSFTWCHKSATKMSKLDRFLISDSRICACPSMSAISVDRYLSDHCPILMRELHCDYGLIPFKVFYYWFELDGFDKLVEDAWKEAHSNDHNPYVKVMKKFRFVKDRIQAWNRQYKDSIYGGMKKFKDELVKLDEIIDKGVGNDGDVSRRHEVLQREFEKHITGEQNEFLEGDVSNEEIKKAVWDCGIDKAPGPDGFTFGFYRRYWKIIEEDAVEAIKWFFQYGRIPKGGGNSSFITLIPNIPNANMVKDFRPISLIGSLYKIVAKILANHLVTVLGDIVNEIQSAFVADRQILDGPFILNELVQWSKKKKKQMMVFKVDFEKAYDSVRCDFIDDILKKFEFSEKWCHWIQTCLCSSRGSVLVNGSPTQKFQFHKGLKQGDPLSLFLFILVMESLHISFQRVVDVGLFNGIKLTRVLEVFHRASGLRINMNKSKLMGISVDPRKVDQAATKIGCMMLKMPFKYLGSRVGDSMSRIASWNEVIDSMRIRLSRWKLKTLSIGGRLTFLKVVLGAIPIYHMSLFKVPLQVLQNMESIRVSFAVPIVGNGRDTSFWDTPWCKDTVLKVLAPRIYALEMRKDISVKSKLSHEGLEFSLRRTPRGGREQVRIDFWDLSLATNLVTDATFRQTTVDLLLSSRPFIIFDLDSLLGIRDVCHDLDISKASCTSGYKYETPILTVLLFPQFFSSYFLPISTLPPIIHLAISQFNLEYVNFHFPFSKFLLSVLEYYKFNFSQLFVLAAARISQSEILCSLYGGLSLSPYFRWACSISISASDLFKVKVGERTLTDEEVSLLKDTEDRVIPPSDEVIVVVEHTIMNELKDVAADKGVITLNLRESQNFTRFPIITIIDPDDQPMWSSTRTVASTPSSAIIQPTLPNNLCIKGALWFSQFLASLSFAFLDLEVGRALVNLRFLGSGLCSWRRRSLDPRHSFPFLIGGPSTVCFLPLTVAFCNHLGWVKHGSSVFSFWRMFCTKCNSKKLHAKKRGTSLALPREGIPRLDSDVRYADVLFCDPMERSLLQLAKSRDSFVRFVTRVKQSKDLHTTNYDQLYAYLNQNQDDANEVRKELALRHQDPLALVAKTYNLPPQYSYDELVVPKLKDM